MSAARHPLPEELELYVMGALDAVTAARLERHVGHCASCAAALAEEARLENSLRELVPAVRRAPAKVVPLRIVPRAAPAPLPVPVPPPARVGWSGTLAAAAAMLVAVWGLEGRGARGRAGVAVADGSALVCEVEAPLCPWPAVMASMAPAPAENACREPAGASCAVQSRMP